MTLSCRICDRPIRKVDLYTRRTWTGTKTCSKKCARIQAQRSGKKSQRVQAERRGGKREVKQRERRVLRASRCPFCGSDDIVAKKDLNHWRIVHVCKLNAESAKGAYVLVQIHGRTAEEALACWNRRSRR